MGELGGDVVRGEMGDGRWDELAVGAVVGLFYLSYATHIVPTGDDTMKYQVSDSMWC